MLKWLVCTLLFLGMGIVMPARSVAMENTSPPEKSIRFKADAPDADSNNLRYVTAVAMFALMAGGALFLLRRRIPWLLLRVRQDSHLNLVERRVIGPRACLYLIEIDGNRVILAQSGERFLQIDPSLTIPTLPPESTHG